MVISRISEPHTNGIHIINGKKVMVMPAHAK